MAVSSNHGTTNTYLSLHPSNVVVKSKKIKLNSSENYPNGNISDILAYYSG